MAAGDPECRPFLKRPVRSLLDLSIGTLLKAYALWVLAGLLVSALLALLLLGSFGGSGGDTGGTVITPGEGDAVALEQYRSVKPGTGKDAVEQRFGDPATRESPTEGITPAALKEDCIGYERAGRPGDVLFFCFTDGQLTSRQTF